MGGGRRSKGRRSRNKDGNGKGREPRWNSKATTSHVYQEYYKVQNIARDEADFHSMLATLASPLPATIRLHAQGTFAKHLRDLLKGELQQGYPKEATEAEKIKTVMHKVSRPPIAIPWYPDENAWRFGCDRETIRKISAMKDLKGFLLQEGEAGNLTRQEEASMIPPFFLDVQRHHKVLDMCAAPGSKTSQILEAIHSEDAKHGFKPPTGLVVANDANEKRAYMLVKQSKRLNSSNLLVTAHEAQRFPSIKLPGTSEEEGFFDRILADVPCSGDGTCRKAPDIWRKFDTSNGYFLHPLQLKIAQRGLQLLKVGGLMVYSTCSLNPVENEAVVAQILRANKGAVELVDASGIVPELKRRPGLSHWKIAVSEYKKNTEDIQSAEQADKKETLYDTDGNELADGAPAGAYLRWFDTPAEAKEAGCGRKIPLTAWPPSEEEKAELPLSRCMRIMPHDQDTSGFFICLFKKVKPISPGVSIIRRYPRDSSAAVEAGEDEVVDDDERGSLKEEGEKGKGAQDQSSKRKSEADGKDTDGGEKKSEEQKDTRDDEICELPVFLYDKLKNSFGFSESDFTQQQFYWRGGDGEMMTKRAQKKRKLEREEKLANQEHFPSNIHFVSQGVSEIIQANPENKLKIVSFGALMFKKNQQGSAVETTYRITQTGVALALPFITKSKLEISINDFYLMWKFCNHRSSDEEIHKMALRFPGMPRALLCEETKERIRAQGLTGSVIASLVPEDQAKYVEQFAEPFAMSLWIGVETINHMVNKTDLNSIFDKTKRAGLLNEDSFADIDVDALIKEHFTPRK